VLVFEIKRTVWENVHAYVISILVADSFLLSLVERVWICRWQSGEYRGEVVYGLVQVNVPPVRQRQGAGRAVSPHYSCRICKQTENVDQSKINLNLVASVSKPVTTTELLYIFQSLVDRLPKCFHFWPTATNLQQTTLILPSVGPSNFNPAVRFLACILERARFSSETPTIRRSVRGFPQRLQG
jgi:hypothetical protein